MDHLSNEFKSRSVVVIDKIMVKLQNYPGEIPFSVGMIQMAKSFFIDPLDGHSLIKVFIEDSAHVWDAIHDRNEEDLIKAFNSEVLDRAPMMTGMISKVLDFAITNRNKLFGDEFENYLWDEVGDLIKISIEYAHLKRERHPNADGVMKYTQRFVPNLSLKKESEKWGVHLM
jgi:hypothetical protein